MPARSDVRRRVPPDTGPDSLSPLHVITRLEVGPPRLEPSRLTAPYRVTRGGKSEQTDLMYRFQEDVFDPHDEASVNLGSMIAAQVALNYGLFCDEIVLNGSFDEADRRFLNEMARNTAREIYVKKFQEPNPFLKGDVAGLPLVKRENYLHARLVLPAVQKLAAREHPTFDRNRHMILSSGGKDSLLSFGILRELKRETHPVFINESGRHWFTALNAHRHFADRVPNTARIWTNADRVFAWMLRRLGFIRPDFLKVRSDEYPIRLWTVAVFLFGALPLALRRGAGRIIIGDEFDTTDRRDHRGVTHYNGLYDQSRYFDNALTRYYARKGWSISQFSILRPLSELLIEKILVERYPDLLRLQMSCHATHLSDGRALPCGQCEKCRRIVAMVSAVGGDPTQCGYSSKQVQRCLSSIASGDIHQEKEGAEHLACLLKRKGLLDAGRIGSCPAREHPEVTKLRFDRERAPANWIPADLREPLVRIVLDHTDGAVQRSGKLWVEVDPRSDAVLSQPYPFESASATASKRRSSKSREGGGHAFVLGSLTWPEAQERLKTVDVALLPVGAIEQHGPHLPLDIDAFDAQYLAERVAAACTDPKPFVLPGIPYGVSYHHDDFSGTVSVSNDALAHFVYDVGMSMARNGITKLIIVNGHGGNAPTLHFAAQMINRDARIFTCVDTGETSDADIAALIETPNDVHAGEFETSTALATRPDMVRMDKARKYVPRFSSKYLEFSSKRSVDWYTRTARLSKSGVMGDPTKASREKGERMWDIMIRNLVELVEHIKDMSLDEIYQRNRY